MTQSTSRAADGAGDESLQIKLREPAATDGPRVARLIADCPPLDGNSLYCNLLQCADFSDSCILAERDDEAIGWISGYRMPKEPDALFIWQVAVHDSARGEGLARAMLTSLLARPAQEGVTKIKATITRDNDASWKLFRSLARALSAPLVSETHFDRDAHFGGEHETEILVTIGPFGAFARA